MSLDQLLNGWVLFGLLGQGLFSCRFLVQWIVSERRRQSVVPEVFWWFSLGGGLCLFTYALHRADLVFSLGQGAGLVVYGRNLVLVRRARSQAAR